MIRPGMRQVQRLAEKTSADCSCGCGCGGGLKAADVEAGQADKSGCCGGAGPTEAQDNCCAGEAGSCCG